MVLPKYVIFDLVYIVNNKIYAHSTVNEIPQILPLISFTAHEGIS